MWIFFLEIVSLTFAFGSRGNIEISRSNWCLNEGTNPTVIRGFNVEILHQRCIKFLLKTVAVDDFNDDDACMMEVEDITGQRNAFDVFIHKDNNL